MRKVFLAADHAGFQLKDFLKAQLQTSFPDLKWEDLGVADSNSVDYPPIAAGLCQRVLEEEGRGILVCGSGQGVAIAANKVAGIRAALCWDVTSARYSRCHNDSNVLCLGERMLGQLVAWDICHTWLTTLFEGGRHSRRVAQIHELEPKKQP